MRVVDQRLGELHVGFIMSMRRGIMYPHKERPPRCAMYAGVQTMSSDLCWFRVVSAYSVSDNVSSGLLVENVSCGKHVVPDLLTGRVTHQSQQSRPKSPACHIPSPHVC